MSNRNAALIFDCFLWSENRTSLERFGCFAANRNLAVKLITFWGFGIKS